MGRQNRITSGIVLAALAVAGLTVLLAHQWHLHQAEFDQAGRTQTLARSLDVQVLQRTRYAAARVASQDLIAASARGDLEIDDPAVLSVLETLRASLDAEIVYVMNLHGDTVASTRFGAAKSLTGQNYSFRPYFALAMVQEAAFYPALGVTTGVRGFYTGVRIPADPAPGVLAVKSGLAEIDAVLAEFAGHALLLSPDGIVFAASDPDWLYHATHPLASDLRARLLDSRQFGAQPLDVLPFQLGEREVRIHGQRLLSARTPLEILDSDGRQWELLTLHDPQANYPYTWMILLALTGFLLSWGTATLIQRRKQHAAMLREQIRSGHLIKRNAAILQGLTQLQREALLEADLPRVFDRMLNLLLEASDSRYGFIGEVLTGADEQPYIKVWAITNIAWNDETLALYRKLATGGFKITNLDSLIGAAIVQRKPVITNDPAHDPRHRGLPKGHPALDSYLGLPLILGNELVGIAGVANRTQGYDHDVITTLEPITTTSASLIVSRRREREREASAASLRKLSLAVEQSPENIIITDTAGLIEYVNAAFELNTGYTRQEAIGKKPNIQASKRTPPAIYKDLWATLAAGAIWSGEITNRHKNGRESIYNAVISPVRDETGAITHYLSVQQDITDRKRAEAEIHRLAYYDPLTGLPNRLLLLDRIKQLLATASRHHQHHALLLLNIDRFKTLNDARGHAVGDSLLCAFARRLATQLRKGDTVARLTADEFALLLPNLDQNPEPAGRSALLVAEKIQSELECPFAEGSDRVIVSASMGIAIFPEITGEDILDILRRADTALHRAKSAGGNQIAFFETSMGEKAQRRFRIEHELRRGIVDQQLRLYLQSQVDAAGRIVGAEALVRWQHPEQGLLSPNVFIPIAEESDLIVDLGAWVFGETCRILADPDVHASGLRLSVNLSARQFHKPGFIAWLKNILATSGTDPSRLTLEVTESLVISDLADVSAKMEALTDLGLRFSLDDFGTGYSSLAYLKRLPISELKIDRMFVQDAPNDPNDAALVETILAVASHLHLTVVAEGVETPEQAAFLRERAEVIHQGYLYGKPKPAAEWLAEWHNPIGVRSPVRIDPMPA